jgi:hypothetical protein
VGINIDVPPAGRRGSIEVDLVEVLVLLFLPDLSVAVSVLVPDSVCVPVSLAVPVEVFFPLLESVAVESAVLVSDAESVLLALESVFVSSDAVVSALATISPCAMFSPSWGHGQAEEIVPSRRRRLKSERKLRDRMMDDAFRL